MSAQDHSLDITFALELLADVWADAKPGEIIQLAIDEINELRSQLLALQARAALTKERGDNGQPQGA